MPSPKIRVINNLKVSPLANPVRVIAVTGGKGGVGKTSVAVNLATGLAAAGRRVVLLDGDLGMANVDVLLGLSPRYTLAHVLSGERTLDEILVTAPQGFMVAGRLGRQPILRISTPRRTSGSCRDSAPWARAWMC